ncbi:hypothetical protein RRG08_065505, partial [Elysia crispata]
VCSMGNYGRGCLERCSEKCVSLECHRETGACRWGCQIGYMGDTCQEGQWKDCGLWLVPKLNSYLRILRYYITRNRLSLMEIKTNLETSRTCAIFTGFIIVFQYESDQIPGTSGSDPLVSRCLPVWV